jgi:hypothetical protein
MCLWLYFPWVKRKHEVLVFVVAFWGVVWVFGGLVVGSTYFPGREEGLRFSLSRNWVAMVAQMGLDALDR